MNNFKKIWKRKGSRAWLLTSTIVLVVLLVASLVLTQNGFLYQSVSIFLGRERQVLVSGDPSGYVRYQTDEGIDNKADALAAANAVNEQIAEEGIVLLKNDGNALPLEDGAKVSVFGKNSVNLVYGGSGSGGARGEGYKTIFDSLAAAGLEYNPTLKSFYEGSASGGGRPANPEMGEIVTGFPTGETPQSAYTSAVKNSYAQYSDAAIIVISRISGEGFDLPRTMMQSYGNTSKVSGARNADDHYLQLDQNETDLIAAVSQAGFDKVIVVVNSANPIELGFLDDPAHYAYSDKIDAALLLGLPGMSGVMALGRVLTGEVNPSGRLADTYARDFKADPTWNNFGDNRSDDGNRYVNESGRDQQFYFVRYEEGIYVGYRYWETRGYTDGEEWYKDHVVYPFGYGLSYTTFSYEVGEFKLVGEDGTTAALSQTLSADDKGKSISVDVTVTNEGDTYTGKEVVQLYVSAPYYEGGIEKSHVVLAAFAKTKPIAPQGEDTVTLEFSLYDIASYDNRDANVNDFKGYELEAGEYSVYVSANAHSWADGDAAVQTFSVPEAEAGKTTGFTYATDGATDNTVENRFDDVSEKLEVTLSRADWDGTMPQLPSDADRTISSDDLAKMRRYTVDDDASDPWYTETAPTQATTPYAKNSAPVQLYEMIGKAYDDPMWEELLNSLTVQEMLSAISTCAFNTGRIDSIGKPPTTEADGPVGFTNFLQDPTIYDTCCYASECVLAATWNVDLAYAMGNAVGNESLIGNVAGDGRPYSGWYACGANIHRSQFGGRNTEYYSEDGLLSGKMGASVVQGARSKGVYTFIKHLALNDQETNRSTMGLVTWADEQSMRELYFKPFEFIVKEGETTGMMSSFNRIGTTWAGGSYELLTEVLRDEWGFKGTVITDYYYATPYMYGDQMLRAGGDLVLGQSSDISADLNTPTQTAMIRRATHNLLYTVANSNAMNGHGSGVVYRYALPYWVIGLICVDVAAVVAFGVWGFFSVRKSLKADAQDIATAGE